MADTQSDLTPSGLPAALTQRVLTAARLAISLHLPLGAEDVAFAGYNRPIGNGATDFTIAVSDAAPGQIAALAYNLLLRACADADEAGDETLANACAEAIELLDGVIVARQAVQQ